MFGGLPIYFLISWGWVCKILCFGKCLILNVKVFKKPAGVRTLGIKTDVRICGQSETTENKWP